MKIIILFLFYIFTLPNFGCNATTSQHYRENSVCNIDNCAKLNFLLDTISHEFPITLDENESDVEDDFMENTDIKSHKINFFQNNNYILFRNFELRSSLIFYSNYFRYKNDYFSSLKKIPIYLQIKTLRI